MKKLLLFSLFLPCLAFADDVHHDANGTILEQQSITGGATTVRDARAAYDNRLEMKSLKNGLTRISADDRDDKNK